MELSHPQVKMKIEIVIQFISNKAISTFELNVYYLHLPTNRCMIYTNSPLTSNRQHNNPFGRKKGFALNILWYSITKLKKKS